MLMRNFMIYTICSLLTVLPCMARGTNGQIKSDFKEAGKDIGKAGKKVGKAIGKGGKETGIAVGKGAKTAGKGVAKGAKEVGKGVKKAFNG